MNNIKEIIFEIKKTLNYSKKVFVFFDSDLDGSCSYIQVKNTYKNVSGFPIGKDLISQKNALKHIKEDMDCFLFLDVPIIFDDIFEKIKNKKIIIIDHHQTSKSLGKKYGALNFNPLNYDEFDNRATSFWAYNLSNQKSKKKNLFWGTLGSVGDFFLLDIIYQLYLEDKKTFNILFENITLKLQKEIFDFLKKFSFDDFSVSQKRSNLIQKLEYTTNFINFKLFFDLLFKFEKQKDTIKILEDVTKLSCKEFSKKILIGKENYFVKYRNMKKLIKSEMELALKIPKKKVLWYESSCEFSFSRQISEELAFKCKNCEVVVCVFENLKKDICSMSFRTKKIDINKIILKSIIGLDAIGGGHKNSAGACVSKNNYQEFKNKILKNLGIKSIFTSSKP